MHNYFVYHTEEGFLEDFETYNEALSYCKKFIEDCCYTDDSVDLETSEGGLRIYKLEAESYVAEVRYRKDYFQNEDSMTDEEYEEAVDEYDCVDPDSPECWIIGMRKVEQDV